MMIQEIKEYEFCSCYIKKGRRKDVESRRRMDF